MREMPNRAPTALIPPRNGEGVDWNAIATTNSAQAVTTEANNN